MEKTKRSPWIIVLVSGIVLVFLCLCGVVLGGGTAFILSGSGIPEKVEINLGGGNEPGNEESQPVPTKPAAQAVQPTIKKAAPTEPVIEPTVIEPTLPEPTEEEVTPVETPEENDTPEETEDGFVLGGKQEFGLYKMFDDFTTDTIPWYQSESDKESVKITDEMYQIQAKGAGGFSAAAFPVVFVPYEFSFDVSSPEKVQDGAFGTICQYTDSENMYGIEFDLGKGVYSIMEFKKGKSTVISKKNAQGQQWLTVKSFKQPPSTVNHIAVSCYLDSITLFVNDTQIDQVKIKDPLTQTGTTMFYVSSTKNSTDGGYTVMLDNIEASEPQP
jgi:hypothetical protein